jgi:hypothetical protein
MRIDKTWDHNVARRVEHSVDASRRHSAASDKLDDAAVIRHNAAIGALCKDCDRVFNPHSHQRVPRNISEKVARAGLGLNLATGAAAPHGSCHSGPWLVLCAFRAIRHATAAAQTTEPPGKRLAQPKRVICVTAANRLGQ